MPEIHFHHDAVGDLVVDTGADEIAWGYNLNTANYPTYGGEVIQILSVFIDDIQIKGTVRTYPGLEKIYSYFARYMTFAAQGPDGHGSYNQKPMKMFYAPRDWTFYIQPLQAPGFIYSLETVAPQWEMHAHVVDKDAGNYKSLKEMVVLHALNNEDFSLQGIISPAAGDPTQNPFSAPGTGFGSQFKEDTPAQVRAQLKHLADYYNTLLPAYLKGDYKSLTDDISSKPAPPISEKAAAENVEPKFKTAREFEEHG